MNAQDFILNGHPPSLAFYQPWNCYFGRSLASALLYKLPILPLIISVHAKHQRNRVFPHGPTIRIRKVAHELDGGGECRETRSDGTESIVNLPTLARRLAKSVVLERSWLIGRFPLYRNHRITTVLKRKEKKKKK